jgi:DNA polymerase-3 subunit epsilon
MAGDRRIAYVDVETTGLHSNDRVVSLGLIVASETGLARGEIDGGALHLVFDPIKKSHPRAEEVHGWDDWVLRHQDRFEVHAAAIAEALDGADLVVAHNAAFDLEFIGRELELAKVATRPGTFECTMLAWREAHPGQRASLNSVIAGLGLKRAGAKHGAMEDAWLAMAVHAALNRRPMPPRLPDQYLAPVNLKSVPPRPDGPLPRRNNRRSSVEVAPVPVAPANPQLATLLAEAGPLATLMLEVAAADHRLTVEEADALTLLVREVGRRLGVSDVRIQHEVVGMLFDLADGPLDIEAAVRAVLASEWQRTEVGRWMKEVTYADGEASDAEAGAIQRISEVIRRVRAS